MALLASVRSSGSDGYAIRLRARQHQYACDEPAPNGGQDTAPDPFELVLGGLVACTAITLKMYAQRHQWELADLEVSCSYFGGKDEQPRVERAIRFPSGLPEEQRTRLLEIAERTPVTLALKQGMAISTVAAAD